jgi:hypothetical protein
MKNRNLVLGGALGVGLLAGGILIAQNPPAPDIDPHRHPHLAQAQKHILEAFDSISHAQQANDWDMQGHAAHAKDLLDQASREVKESARVADHH